MYVCASIDHSGKKMSWSEEQEEELRQLYIENQNNPSTEQGNISNKYINRFFYPIGCDLRFGIVVNNMDYACLVSLYTLHTHSESVYKLLQLVSDSRHTKNR